METDHFTYADIEKISCLQPEGWPDIIEAFRFYCSHDFCYPITISIGKRIVGIGCAIVFDRTAWVAHIIVHAEYRKRGIGSAIVDSLLSDIKRRGIETSLLIATELGQPVYTKAGFRRVATYCSFNRDPALHNQYHSDNIIPYRNEFYSDIMQLDACVSGENREILLQEYVNSALVYIRNTAVEGFYIPSLGEGPICAATAEAGVALMRYKYSTIHSATMPQENTAAIACIQELGFVKSSAAPTRMIAGPDIAWKPEMMYSRIGGNFG